MLERDETARDPEDFVFLAPAGERPRRREELVELAEAQGMERSEAEEIYDISREERLEPSLAFEIVRRGLAVKDLEVPDAEPLIEVGEPEWVDTPPPEEPERERKLRTSFRRLRGFAERTGSAEAAIAAYRDEPDVEEIGFG